MRIKRGTVSKRKHRKLLKSVKGFRMTKRKLVKVASEASLHAGAYAYTGRKDKKSFFRKLWITRISGFLKGKEISYSRFMHLLKQKNIILDRKSLSYLIQNDPEGFKFLLDKVKKS